MENTQYIDIDISGTEQTPFEIVTQQYNVGGKIVFRVTEGGVPIDVGDYVVSMWMKKPDDTTIIDTYTVEGGTITVKLTYQMTVVSGRVEYNIRFCRFTDSAIRDNDGIPLVMESGATIEDGILDLGYDDGSSGLEFVTTVKGVMVVMPSAVTELDITSQSTWPAIEKICYAITSPNYDVKGIRGEAEDEYRTGKVIISKANINLSDGRNVIISETEPDATSTGGTLQEKDIWLKFIEGDDGEYNEVEYYIYSTGEWQPVNQKIFVPAGRVNLENGSNAQDAITDLQSRTTASESDIDNLKATVGITALTGDCALVTDENGKLKVMNGVDGVYAVSSDDIAALRGISHDKTIQQQLEEKVATTFEKDRIMGTREDDGSLMATDITKAELGILNGIKAVNPPTGQSTIPGDATLADKLGSIDANIATVQGNISSLTTTVNGKQNKYDSTAPVSTLWGNPLTASRALVSNSAGKVGVSSITSTELGYLDNVSGNIQTQLNGKVTGTIKTLSQSVKCTIVNSVSSATFTLSHPTGIATASFSDADFRIDGLCGTGAGTCTVLWHGITLNKTATLNLFYLATS